MKLTTTPNWFQETFSKALGTGQENQFGSTRGLRYGPLRINKTGIFVNNGTLDSTIINNTGFHGYGLTGSEQITLDATTGLNVTDGVSSVLKAEISGTNVGDVTIGDYSGGYGAFYDKSSSTFTIKGTLSAVNGTFNGSIAIGSGDNIFKADSNGIYLGNASFASAPFRVTMAGALTATNATITGAITATSGSFTGSITSTSGSIGGWTIGSTSLYSSGVTLSTSNGGFISLTNGTSSILLESNNSPPYIAFTLSGSLKGVLLPTSAGSGGVRLLDGDLVLNNNRSVLINDTTGGSSLYGGISITNSNQFWLTLGTDNTFYMKNNAQNDNYFTVSSSQAYHKAKFTASEGSFTTENSTTINNTTLNGNTINYWNLNYYSDMSLKKNISNLETDFESLSKLQPIEFKYKKDKSNKKHLGFIAQDFEKVFPDLVSTNEKGIKGTDITQLIPLLVGAVNQLKEEVTQLQIKSL